MGYQDSMLAQILRLITKDGIEGAINKYLGDKWVKKFNTKNHLTVMLYGQALATGLKKVKKRKKEYRQRRMRMPKEGMLVQMDSSYHQWIEDIPEKWYLIAMIDDASGRVYSAKFFEKDTTFNNMEVIKNWIKKKGLFIALYVDKASHFYTTRHGGIHYDLNDEHADTQIQMALEELDIRLITANSVA